MPAQADTSYSKLVGDELPRLQRIARLLVGNAARADEVVSQTLLRNQPKYREGTMLDPSGALRRTIVALAPRNRDQASVDWLAVPDPEAPVDERAVAQDRTVRAVRALPVRRRAAVVLHHYDGLTPARIGEVLGRSDRAVTAALAKAHASLRTDLGSSDLSEPVEQRLRRDLGAVNAAPLPAPGAIVAMAERTRRRTVRSRRKVSMVLVAAVLTVVGIGVWRNRSSFTSHTAGDGSTPSATSAPSGGTTVPSDGSAPATQSTTQSTTGTTQPAPSTTLPLRAAWAAVPADPRGVTTGGRVVWTGSEALMVGGHANDGTPRNGVVAYDPAGGQWRVVSGGALPVADPLVFWTGSTVLAIGNPAGSSVPLTAELDEPTGSWRIGSAAPLPFTVGADTTAVWTGHEVLVIVGPATALRYDPATDEWTAMPAPPMFADRGMASVWTGTQWLVWGGTNGTNDFALGARYDAATNTWAAMAAAPLSARRFRSTTGAAWTGTEMIVAAGASGGDPVTGNLENALADGAAYDPASDSWHAIADGPAHPGFTPVWTGSAMVLFAKGGAFAYHPGDDHWTDAFTTNVPHDDTSPVWTGTAVLLLGSYDASTGGAVLTLSR